MCKYQRRLNVRKLENFKVLIISLYVRSDILLETKLNKKSGVWTDMKTGII